LSSIVRIELVGLGFIVVAIVESQLNTGHSTEKLITFTILSIGAILTLI
jgi:hypothetical protein